MIRPKKKTYAVSVTAAVLLAALAVLTGCIGPKKGVRGGSNNLHGERAYRYFMDGDLPSAVAMYKRGFAASRRVDDGLGAARSLSNIGRVYYEWERIDSASVFFARAYEEFNILGRKDEASRAAAWLALCFASAGDESSARQWFNAATVSANTDKPKSNRHFYALMKAMIDVKLTSNIGDERALEAARKFYSGKKNHAALSTIFILTADVELSRGNCAVAQRHLNNALISTEHSRELYKRRNVLLMLSKVSFCIGDDNTGRHYYNRAADITPRGVGILQMSEVSSQ